MATSSTSLAVGTGSTTFATQSGLAYTAGARARASSAADGANYMEGLVTSYSGTSLAINADTIGGSGTHTDWDINLAVMWGRPEPREQRVQQARGVQRAQPGRKELRARREPLERQEPAERDTWRRRARR